MDGWEWDGRIGKCAVSISLDGRYWAQLGKEGMDGWGIREVGWMCWWRVELELGGVGDGSIDDEVDDMLHGGSDLGGAPLLVLDELGRL